MRGIGAMRAHKGFVGVMAIGDLASHEENGTQHPGAPPSSAARPRVAVIATVHWPATTRLCLEMADGGMEVRALVPDDHALFKMCTVTVERLGRTRNEALRTIARTVERYSPDLLIPADESAIDLLRALYERALSGRGARPDRTAKLVEASLGAPSSFVFARKKSLFVSLARDEGLSVPKTEVVRDLGQLQAYMATARFPLVIKRDETSGGEGVRIVANEADARRTFLDLQASSGRVFAVRQAVRKLDLAYLQRLCRPRPSITVQDYIEGRPANRAVVCDRGQVLAGLSVEVLQTSQSTGPATVVRVIDSAEMANAAAHVVRRLGLSGFVGFDFMLETASSRAYLIEMNQRPTQICHLALNASSDLIGALAAGLSAAVRRRTMPNIGSRTVALFPQESWRDPSSGFLQSAHHDVPWREPEFIAAYRQPVAPEPRTWVQVVRQALRNPRRLFDRQIIPPEIDPTPAPPQDLRGKDAIHV
jgi:glutathione synthase/RimK-type ligase-like ATP-grasp enzyme